MAFLCVTHHVGAHGVARPEGENVGDGAALLDVLRHAGRVLGEPLGVDEPTPPPNTDRTVAAPQIQSGSAMWTI